MNPNRTPDARELTAAEMQQAGGGAIYMTVEGLRGDVAAGHGAGGGGGTGKVNVHDLSMS